MPSGDHCCNADGDYCPSDETCSIGDNGVAGCCPIGESCTGDGGTQTVGGATLIGGAATSSFTSLPTGGLAQTTGLGSSLSLETTFTSWTVTLGGGGSTVTASVATAKSTGAAASGFSRDSSLWAMLFVAVGNMLL